MGQLILALTMTAVLAQPQPRTEPALVALAFENHRFEMVALDQARREFAALASLKSRTPEQQKRYAALVWALGTIPTHYTVCDGHQPLCETTRGRRVPLQSPVRD